MHRSSRRALTPVPLLRSSPSALIARALTRRPGVSPAAGGLVCDAQKEPNPGAGPVDALYSTQFPMARLAQGQAVRWRWPAKNHATVGVQRGVQVYLSTAANQGDAFPTAA
eukprot:5682099-Prymnesium_polylepis.1